MAPRAVRLPTGQDLVVEDTIANPDEWALEPDEETRAAFPNFGLPEEPAPAAPDPAEVAKTERMVRGDTNALTSRVQSGARMKAALSTPVPAGQYIPLGGPPPNEPALPIGEPPSREGVATAAEGVREGVSTLNTRVKKESKPQSKPQKTAGGGVGGAWVDPLKQKQSDIEERESALFLDSLLLEQQRQGTRNQYNTEAMLAEQRAAQVLAEERQRADLARQEVEQETRRLMSRVESTAEEAANHQIDYDRFWSSRSNFARAIGSLSIILGTQSSRGNVGRELLDQAIEREVTEQQFAAEQAWRRNQAASNAFSQYLSAYGSPQAARENLRGVLYAQMEQQRKQDLLRAGYNKERVEGDETIIALRLRRQQALLEAESATLAAQMKARQQAALLAAQRAKANEPNEELALYSHGQKLGYASNAKHLKAAQETLSGIEAMEGHVARLEELSQNTERLVPGSKTYAEWQARKSAAQIALKDAARLGQISKHDVAYLSAQIPGPQSLRPQAILAEQRKMLDERKKNLLSTTVVDTEGNPKSGPLPQGEEEVE